MQIPTFSSVFYTNFQTEKLEVALTEKPEDLNSSFILSTSLKLHPKIS